MGLLWWGANICSDNSLSHILQIHLSQVSKDDNIVIPHTQSMSHSCWSQGVNTNPLTYHILRIFTFYGVCFPNDLEPSVGDIIDGDVIQINFLKLGKSSDIVPHGIADLTKKQHCFLMQFRLKLLFSTFQYLIRYHKISWNLEAMRCRLELLYRFELSPALWALLQRCLSNFRAIQYWTNLNTNIMASRLNEILG